MEIEDLVSLAGFVVSARFRPPRRKKLEAKGPTRPLWVEEEQRKFKKPLLSLMALKGVRSLVFECNRNGSLWPDISLYLRLPISFFVFGALKMTLVMMAQGITMAFLTTGGEKTSEGEDPYSRYAI